MDDNCRRHLVRWNKNSAKKLLKQVFKFIIPMFYTHTHTFYVFKGQDHNKMSDFHFYFLGSWLSTRQNNEPLEEVLTRRENCSVILHVEKQGESIAFQYNNLGFYTTSEGKNPPIYYYKFEDIN